jgi:hypothetical protein
MKFFKSAIVLGLVTSVFASPVPQDSSTDIAKRLVELEDAVYGLINEKREAELDASTLNHLVARATINDKKCPDNGITYQKADITSHVAPKQTRRNTETKKATRSSSTRPSSCIRLASTVSYCSPPAVNLHPLDHYSNIFTDVARAVFSRKKDGKYLYRGLMEHDKGTGNGFHKCE